MRLAEFWSFLWTSYHCQVGYTSGVCKYVCQSVRWSVHLLCLLKGEIISKSWHDPIWGYVLPTLSLCIQVDVMGSVHIWNKSMPGFFVVGIMNWFVLCACDIWSFSAIKCYFSNFSASLYYAPSANWKCLCALPSQKEGRKLCFCFGHLISCLGRKMWTKNRLNYETFTSWLKFLFNRFVPNLFFCVSFFIQ